MGNYVSKHKGLVRTDELSRLIYSKISSSNTSIQGKEIERGLLSTLDMDKVLAVRGDRIVLEIDMEPIPFLTAAYKEGCKKCGIDPESGKVPTNMNIDDALNAIQDMINRWTATEVSRAVILDN